MTVSRFYIKCTDCVSEICFRTDPATTDYIIEVKTKVKVNQKL